MLDQKPSTHLSTLALNRLIQCVTQVQFSLDGNQLDQVRNHLRKNLTASMWGLWAQQLLIKLNGTGKAICLAFGPELQHLDLDLLDDQLEALGLITLSPLIQSLISRYSPFFWGTEHLKLFQESVAHLGRLQRLTLNHLDLRGATSTLFETLGTRCPQLVELDLSHGIVPAEHFMSLGMHCKGLKVLICRSREAYQYLTTKLACHLIISLNQLRIFDDDTGSWSCVLPALGLLEEEHYDGRLPPLEYLPVYKIVQLNAHFRESVSRLLLTSAVARNYDSHDVWNWIHENFPNLQGINMKLKQVPRTKLETLIGSGVFPHIHSLFISNCQMDPQVLVSLNAFAPNLELLELIDVTFEPTVVDYQGLPRRRFCNKNLRRLSYTGLWNDKIAAFFLGSNMDYLEGNLKLEELHLAIDCVPAVLARPHRLSKLKCLQLDVQSGVVDVDFLASVLRNAANLTRIQLTEQFVPLLQDWQIQLDEQNLSVQLVTAKTIKCQS